VLVTAASDGFTDGTDEGALDGTTDAEKPLVSQTELQRQIWDGHRWN
jgi:hypothetical protein